MQKKATLKLFHPPPPTQNDENFLPSTTQRLINFSVPTALSSIKLSLNYIVVVFFRSYFRALFWVGVNYRWRFVFGSEMICSMMCYIARDEKLSKIKRIRWLTIKLFNLLSNLVPCQRCLLEITFTRIEKAYFSIASAPLTYSYIFMQIFHAVMFWLKFILEGEILREVIWWD